ncbi:MAG: MFS transporter [Rhodospirillaceae bacterium]|jgi:DHA1 family tetracycline resistance protein-like MFS transporter|nr:MFS transporter [Rhodospirillaceae bacterium]MBT7488089.1 MFS transporter [Rhodospirillales bacterium]MBT4703111.1 MFS transporter [Rhodospirillaceae bacterium]MBT5033377.1 MFS transporter [Rhodospirillaceae bacterium]MBT6219221.1 MFS transporter [Rhodospirillaceae bacterium]
MLPLFLIVFIDLMGFGIIIPLLPFYAEHFHADPFTVGLVMATYSLTQLIAAPVWGRMSDRIGRRPVLLITLAGTAASYIWLGFVDSLAALFAARAIGGAMAGNISAAFAYMADITTREDRAKGMGLIGAAFGLGFIVGPAIGGLLAGADPATADYSLPAFAAAGLSLVALVLAVAILKESLSEEIRARIAARPPEQRFQRMVQAFKTPKLGFLIMVSFLATFVFAGMEATFAMWSERTYAWGPQQNGFLFAGVGIVSAAIQGGLIGRLANRFGEAKLIIQGSVALAIGMVLIPFSENLWILALAMAVLAYGFSTLSPSLNSLISLQVDDENQGAIMGVTRSATTFARIVGPAWAGLLFAQLGKDWPYFVGGGMMLLVAALSIFALLKKPSNES